MHSHLTSVAANISTSTPYLTSTCNQLHIPYCRAPILLQLTGVGTRLREWSSLPPVAATPTARRQPPITPAQPRQHMLSSLDRFRKSVRPTVQMSPLRCTSIATISNHLPIASQDIQGEPAQPSLFGASQHSYPFVVLWSNGAKSPCNFPLSPT